MTVGFLTIAQNGQHDYLRMAYALALSLKLTQQWLCSDLAVLVTPGMHVPPSYYKVFHQVIEIPVDDADQEDWKIHNKWQALSLTPFDHTILVDADMLFPTDISEWWKILQQRHVWACTNPRTFRNEPFQGRYYREAFDRCGLPDIYTAFMYFDRSSGMSQGLFRTTQLVYQNWDRIRKEVYHHQLPEKVSGDMAFAVAMDITGTTDRFTAPGSIPSFVHMKTRGQGFLQQDSMKEEWTRHLTGVVQSNGRISIGTYDQILPFHYHDKSFLTDEIIDTLEAGHGGV